MTIRTNTKGELLQPRVLFIDDSISQLSLYQSQTAAQFEVALANNYEEAIATLTSAPPDLIVLDLMMPQVNGLEFLDILHASPSLRDIPVIMVSAENDIDVVRSAFLKGAGDYVRKPYDAEELRLRIQRLLELRPRPNHSPGAATAQLKNVRSMMIQALSDLAATRDNETGNHLNRIEKFVGVLTLAAAKKAQFKSQIDSVFLESMAELAILHDIGKVGIPDHILNKPGQLTPDEFTIMKTHATIGSETIDRVKKSFPEYSFLEFARQIARHHHERWDGSGYPDGLAGEDIPLAARIVGIADVFDALTTKRVYKPAFDVGKALEIMKMEQGKQFDPLLFDVFLDKLPEFAKIHSAFCEK